MDALDEYEVFWGEPGMVVMTEKTYFAMIHELRERRNDDPRA
jgi:hypothetical protein